MARGGEKIIGIDLGTTNSVVAVMEGKEAKVIPNQEGNRLTPSVVAFTDKGDVLVGDPAPSGRDQSTRRSTRSSASWAVGTTKCSEEKMVPYEVVGGPDDYVKVKIGDKEYTPPEISAKILRKLKEAAEAYLGHKVNKAVITVPGLLQRRPAASHERCRPDCRPGSRAHHQRADRRRVGLWTGQERTRKDRRVRLGRRYVRRLGAGSCRRRVSRDQHQRRYAPGWRRLRRSADQLRRRRIQERARHRSAQRHDGLAAFARGVRKGQEGTQLGQSSTDINLPFITADANGPKHLQMNITRCEVRATGRSR